MSWLWLFSTWVKFNSVSELVSVLCCGCFERDFWHAEICLVIACICDCVCLFNSLQIVCMSTFVSCRCEFFGRQWFLMVFHCVSCSTLVYSFTHDGNPRGSSQPIKVNIFSSFNHGEGKPCLHVFHSAATVSLGRVLINRVIDNYYFYFPFFFFLPSRGWVNWLSTMCVYPKIKLFVFFLMGLSVLGQANKQLDALFWHQTSFGDLQLISSWDQKQKAPLVWILLLFSLNSFPCAPLNHFSALLLSLEFFLVY